MFLMGCVVFDGFWTLVLPWGSGGFDGLVSSADWLGLCVCLLGTLDLFWAGAWWRFPLRFGTRWLGCTGRLIDKWWFIGLGCASLWGMVAAGVSVVLTGYGIGPRTFFWGGFQAWFGCLSISFLPWVGFCLVGFCFWQGVAFHSKSDGVFFIG